MGTNYKRGARIERKIIDLYKKEGYWSIRTAGSHGVFDVISGNKNVIILTQCKTQKSSPKSIIAEYNKYKSETDKIALTDAPDGVIVKELIVNTDFKGMKYIMVL